MSLRTNYLLRMQPNNVSKAIQAASMLPGLEAEGRSYHRVLAVRHPTAEGRIHAAHERERGLAARERAAEGAFHDQAELYRRKGNGHGAHEGLAPARSE